MFRRVSTLLLLLPLLLTACTTTTVTKNPTDCDQGIRYYRPKPYLLIQPTGTPSDQFVSISLHYLPDFSEEYSIRVRAGLGINETNIALQDGWNLTQISQKLDSQFDENLGAVADLIGALPIPTAAKSRDAASLKMVVRATNVPLGFYASVIGCGPDGKKSLCGWRYVGFQPFNTPCSGQVPSGPSIGGDPTAVYALAFERGVMTFRQIALLENGADHDREIVDRTAIWRLPRIDATAGPALEKIRQAALAHLQQYPWGQGLSIAEIAAERRPAERTVVVAVHLTAAQREAISDTLSAVTTQLEAQLLPTVRHALLDDHYELRIQWVQ
jgi:hypothetical protein